MSHTTPAGAVTTVPVAESAAAAVDVASSLRRPGRLRDERGMNTVEYAIGIVLVLVTIGLIIASIQMGWFDVLVKELVTAFFSAIKTALGLP